MELLYHVTFTLSKARRLYLSMEGTSGMNGLRTYKLRGLCLKKRKLSVLVCAVRQRKLRKAGEKRTLKEDDIDHNG